jgi:RecJ-like exonuclease
MTDPQKPKNPEAVKPGTPGAGENTCRRCHGTGKQSDGTTCPECLGTGKVTTPLGGA